LVVIGGAAIAAMQGRLLGVLDTPADHLIAEHLLRMLGVPADEAERIASLPLGEPVTADARPSGQGGAR
jgi:hypothetical protein